MSERISLAIESSCRHGGAAIARGDAIVAEIAFDASQRHAVSLVGRLRDLLTGAGLSPADLGELYISAGPGSFTGLRVGITVARTMAQAIPGLRCVAVPTALAVLENFRDMDWQNLGVILDASEGAVWPTVLARRDGRIIQASQPVAMLPAEFLAGAPRPITLVGEGLGFHDLTADGVTIVPPGERHFPTGRGVWQVGRRLADEGAFVGYQQLLPIYSRKPLAQRVWEQKNPAT